MFFVNSNVNKDITESVVIGMAFTAENNI